MSITTLRPAGSGSIVGSLVGGATLHDVLSDNSNSSYAQSSGNGSGFNVYVCALFPASFNYAPRQRIASLRTRLTVASDVTQGDGKIESSLVDGRNLYTPTGGYGTTLILPKDFYLPSIVFATGAGEYNYAMPDGTQFTKAFIDGMLLYVYKRDGSDDAAAFPNMKIAEAYLDVELNSAPSTVLTSFPNVPRPTIAWTYSDPEGDLQEKARVKIFASPAWGSADYGFRQKILDNIQPLAYLRLKESAGVTIAKDEVNGYPGLYIKGVYRDQPGPFVGSKSVRFDGATGCIQLSQWKRVISSTDTTMTIGAFIKTGSNGGSGGKAIYCERGPLHNYMLRFMVAGASAPNAPGHLGMAFVNDFGTVTSFASTAAVNDNLWHFVAVTINGTTMKFYIDGVLDSTHTISAGSMTTGAAVYIPAFIGRDYTDSSQYFNGYMSEFFLAQNTVSVTNLLDAYINKDFDPDYSTPVWDSGEILGTDTSVALDMNLTRLATYRAYVKAVDVDGNNNWSPWSYLQLTTSWTPLTAPATINAVSNGPTNPYIAVSITQTDWATIGSTSFVLERALISDGVWKEVPSVSYTPVTMSGATYTFLDYEAPPGKAVKYRVKRVGLADHFESAYTADSNTVTLSITDWWLIDPPYDRDGYNGSSMKINVMSPFGQSVDEQRAAMHALGRRYPVVVSDTVGGYDGTLNLDTVLSADYTALKAKAELQNILILKSPIDNEQWYIRLDNRRFNLIGWSVTDNYRQYAISYTDVGPPN